jgi:hypothetical protein
MLPRADARVIRDGVTRIEGNEAGDTGFRRSRRGEHAGAGGEGLGEGTSGRDGGFADSDDAYAGRARERWRALQGRSQQRRRIAGIDGRAKDSPGVATQAVE